MTPEERRDFIVAHAVARADPFVPEIELWTGGDSMTLWEAAALADLRPAVPPPYWAWPWAGGLALARYVLDHPERVRGRTALDVGTGGGIVAIAAAMAGAVEVAAVDIEPFAIEACRLNAELNGTSAAVSPLEADPAGTDDGWDVVLVGDLWYEPELAGRMEPWLRGLAARGAEVLTGDLGRVALPADGLAELAAYEVATLVDLEDTDRRSVRVYRLSAGPGT